MRVSGWDLAFWIIVVACLATVVRPGSKAGQALVTLTDALAAVIGTATGFDLLVNGDIAFSVDGASLKHSDTVTYRGMMFTGVPAARFSRLQQR